MVHERYAAHTRWERTLVVYCKVLDTLKLPFCEMRRDFEFYESVIKCLTEARIRVNFRVIDSCPFEAALLPPKKYDTF